MAMGAGHLARAVCRARSEADAVLSVEEVENFLRTGKIIRIHSTSVGVTGSLHATLSDERVTHDAHIQTIDESKPMFVTTAGTEINFRDTWKYNVAAYRLDTMLGIHMTPPSVERHYGGTAGCFTWWIDDAMMESQRVRKKINPPDVDSFNKQMYIVRVFDQLIYNTDRNLQNLLITPDWNLWMIDHTRAFRLFKDLREPKNLVKCERRLLGALKGLKSVSLRERMGHMLTSAEENGLLGRRDKIVELFEDRITRNGEVEILYDFPERRLLFHTERSAPV